jgi:hypothetical protein
MGSRDALSFAPDGRLRLQSGLWRATQPMAYGAAHTVAAASSPTAPGAMAASISLGLGVLAAVFGAADRPRLVRIGARLGGGAGIAGRGDH